MPFFGYGERFKESKEHTPGPGEYDPTKAKGYKADPKSGFTGKERFNESEREEGLSTSQIAVIVRLLAQLRDHAAAAQRENLETGSCRRTAGVLSSKRKKEHASCWNE